MKSATQYYNKEDMWQICEEPEKVGGKPKTMAPYYVTMKLPGQTREEFLLMLPFSPLTTNEKQPRYNMEAWIAARCDGENYGKLLLYQFPKNTLTEGPMLVSGRMNQDGVISKDFTLWNQQGSEVVLGNFLVIPLSEGQLMYVQPIFLKAPNSRFPELKRVMVASREKIGYAETFEQALLQVLESSQSAAAPSSTPQPSSVATSQPPPARSAASAAKAAQLLERYKKETAAGNYEEAGRALRELSALLQQLMQEGK
jgi:uncharacterized membrane protein (UPF0182 family)